MLFATQMYLDNRLLPRHACLGYCLCTKLDDVSLMPEMRHYEDPSETVRSYSVALQESDLARKGSYRLRVKRICTLILNTLSSLFDCCFEPKSHE